MNSEQKQRDLAAAGQRAGHTHEVAAQPHSAVNAGALALPMACVITMIAVATVFMNQSIFVDIARSFALDAKEARFAFSIVSLSYSFAFFVVGPLADMFESRRLAAAGLGALAVLLLAAAQAQDYIWFLACMGLMGVGAAAVPASMFPYVARTAPPRTAGIHIGAVVASATLGIVVGRAVLGASTDLVGWRGSYRLLSLVFILFSLGALYVLKESNRPVSRSTPDVRGLYAAMLRILVAPATASLLLTGFLLFFGFLGVITFLTYRLAAPPFSFSAAQVGYISLAGITAVIAPFSGDQARRLGAYGIIFPGLAVCIAAMQLLGWSQSVGPMVVGILLLFLGVYACQPLLFMLMGQRIPPQAMGCASSLYILCCIGGGSLASIVLGGVWEKHGWAGITLACSGSIVLALIMAVVSARSGRARCS